MDAQIHRANSPSYPRRHALVAVAVLLVVGLGLCVLVPFPLSPLNCRISSISSLLHSRRGSWQGGGSNRPATQQQNVDVLVAMVNAWSMWGRRGSNFVEPGCGNYRGRPLNCRFANLVRIAGEDEDEGVVGGQSLAAASRLMYEADGLIYHLHPPLARPPGVQPNVPLVLMSLESAVRFPAMDNPGQMRHITLEFTHRTCAQVFEPYYTLMKNMTARQRLAELQTRPLAFARKLDAVMYVNGNCNTPNGRHVIMRRLMALVKERNSSLQVHSYGKCDRNVNETEAARFQRSGRWKAKIKYGRRYKFCVAMENSNSWDYVTEKVYEALQAGCLPIYYGAPNIADFVPDMNGLLLLPDGSDASVEWLLGEMERLAANRTAYEEKLAWKARDISRLSPGFQRLYAQPPIPSSRCRLCRLLAEHRDEPRNYTLCLANSTWQQAQAGAAQPGNSSRQ